MANHVNALEDISPDFKPNAYDAYVASEIIKYEGTPYAIIRFTQLCLGLYDNAFWFFLSTLWVSYSGWSDLNLWRKHFRNSGRSEKRLS
ncbi:hypothetical protein [Gordoniibacillus kamchatkensis]|uniref:hypothetical protein n=1 Tax=Gordoniibacillus kamchatkensis TaxID=1590651 RepID=UPI0018CDE4C3|nr:hypothetical protein [Paenibacillus sp. VKM B-2647]